MQPILPYMEELQISIDGKLLANRCSMQLNPTKHDIEHSKWYRQVKKVVLSKTLNEENLINTRVISENLVDEIGKLKQTTEKEILIFGSPTAGHSLTAANLIYNYWFNINPVLLGNGIPVLKI